MKLTKTEKKQLVIFGVITFGLTFLLGILMYFGKRTQADTSAMIAAQMMYPALGVIIAVRMTEKEDKMVPKYFYTAFLIVSGVMVITGILSIFFPAGVWEDMSGLAITIGTIVCVVALFLEDEEKRKTFGLSINNPRSSVMCFGLFIILYFISNVIVDLAAGNYNLAEDLFSSANTGIALLMLVPSMLGGSMLICFGEEYGWRYFLQPKLQKGFGKIKGVLLVGVIWGIWHLPVDIVSVTEYKFIYFFTRIVVCISMGIFLAYIYMKTNNIWAAAAIHASYDFLNQAGIGEGGGAPVGAPVSEWMAVFYMLISFSVYAIFIFSKEFRKKKPDTAAGA